jgi:hypothetical protein
MSRSRKTRRSLPVTGTGDAAQETSDAAMVFAGTEARFNPIRFMGKRAHCQMEKQQMMFMIDFVHHVVYR